MVSRLTLFYTDRKKNDICIMLFFKIITIQKCHPTAGYTSVSLVPTLPHFSKPCVGIETEAQGQEYTTK